jgi:hypothetical protein
MGQFAADTLSADGNKLLEGVCRVGVGAGQDQAVNYTQGVGSHMRGNVIEDLVDNLL